jgi:hypothetical protein
MGAAQASASALSAVSRRFSASQVVVFTVHGGACPRAAATHCPVPPKSFYPLSSGISHRGHTNCIADGLKADPAAAPSGSVRVPGGLEAPTLSPW